MLKIAHLVNPVKVAKNHELFTAQPITFESIQKAISYSQRSDFKIVIRSTQYEEDHEIIPDFIRPLSNLTRSVVDCEPNDLKRKLPLIADVLEKAREVDDAHYIIYSNIDIGVMPYFYDSVFEFIHKGHDAIVINKRRVSSRYNNPSQLSEIYADLGKSHPGFDCFIFKKELRDHFVLSEICVGVPFLGVSLLHNILAFSKNPKIVIDAHLTFHIGMNVLGFNKDSHYKHNKYTYFNKIYPKIKDRFDLKKFPYAKVNLIKRSMKWILNPSIFTVDYLNLEGKNKARQIKLKLDEIRWRVLQR